MIEPNNEEKKETVDPFDNDTPINLWSRKPRNMRELPMKCFYVP